MSKNYPLQRLKLPRQDRWKKYPRTWNVNIILIYDFVIEFVKGMYQLILITMNLYLAFESMLNMKEDLDVWSLIVEGNGEMKDVDRCVIPIICHMVIFNKEEIS